MYKDKLISNVHGKIEDWHRDHSNGVSPIPWTTDENGDIMDSMGRRLFKSALVSTSQGFVESNLDNSSLICYLVNKFYYSGEIHDLQKMQNDIIEWADSAFPSRTPGIALLKMFSEIGEVIDNPTDPMEWADILVLLLDAASLNGISGDQLTKAFIEKMGINRNREWREGRLGVMSHVKDCKEINNE